jgi:ABC-type sugar transport system substrate-binding protein
MKQFTGGAQPTATKIRCKSGMREEALRMSNKFSLIAATFALSVSPYPLEAKELNSVGVIVGPLGNPFYVALAKGIETEVKKINPDGNFHRLRH